MEYFVGKAYGILVLVKLMYFFGISPMQQLDNFLQADLMECCSASLLLQSRIFLQSKTTATMWVIHVQQHWAGLESCAAVREYSLQLHWADLDSPGCCSYITMLQMLHSCVSSRHSALSNVILQIIHTAATAAWHPSHSLIFTSFLVLWRPLMSVAPHPLFCSHGDS